MGPWGQTAGPRKRPAADWSVDWSGLAKVHVAILPNAAGDMAEINLDDVPFVTEEDEAEIGRGMELEEALVTVVGVDGEGMGVKDWPITEVCKHESIGSNEN